MVFGEKSIRAFLPTEWGRNALAMVCIHLVTLPLSLSGAVGAGEFVSPCESGDNMGEPSTLDEHRGPLPLNKTLFLGYAFLLTMATTSDKLASRSKLPDGPSGSSEEEEGKAWGGLGALPPTPPSFPSTLCAWWSPAVCRGGRTIGNWGLGQEKLI